MNNQRWAVGLHHSNCKWAVYKYGKVIKLYDTKEEAQDELARCIEDDQWHANNNNRD